MGEANLIGPNPKEPQAASKQMLRAGGVFPREEPPNWFPNAKYKGGVPGKVAKKGKLCNYISISKNKSRHQSVRVEEMFRSMKKP